MTDQDATVLGAVLDAGRALVIALNKWDGRSDYERQQAEALASRKLGFVDWAERVRISALHGSGLRRVVQGGASRMPRRPTPSAPPTSPAPSRRRMPPIRRRWCRARGEAALRPPGWRHPPTFVVHGTRLKTLSPTYHRYLENFFRKRQMVGTPDPLRVQARANPHEGKKNVLSERQVAKKRWLLRHVKRD